MERFSRLGKRNDGGNEVAFMRLRVYGGIVESLVVAAPGADAYGVACTTIRLDQSSSGKFEVRMPGVVALCLVSWPLPSER